MFTDGKGNFFETEDELENWEFVSVFAEITHRFETDFQGTIILNPVQYRKYIEVVEYLKTLAAKYNGTVRIHQLCPTDLCGYASVQLPMLDEFGDGVAEFKTMLEKVNVFSIDVDTEGAFSIGINVNRVFEIVERR